MAHVIEVPEKSMSAQERCDRCGAQAYVEVALENGTLLFCAHHAREHWDQGPKGGLMAVPYAMIADHRPHLARLEGETRTQGASY